MKNYASLIICMGLLLSSNNLMPMDWAARARAQKTQQEFINLIATAPLNELDNIRRIASGKLSKPALSAVDAAIQQRRSPAPAPAPAPDTRTDFTTDATAQRLWTAVTPTPTAANLARLNQLKAELEKLRANIANYKNVPADFATAIAGKIRAVETSIATASGPTPPPPPPPPAPTSEADIIKLTAEIKATRDAISKLLPTIANNNIKTAVQNNVIAAAP